MKFRLLSLITVVFISLTLVGCNNNAVSFEINFDINGGSIVESVTYDGSNVITIPDNPTKDGFIFDGWFWDNGTFEVPFTANLLLDTPIEDDLTVYAKWTINQYTITFNSNQGTAVSSITQDYGTTVIQPTDPTREGYTFDGWYSDAGLTQAYTFSTMPAEDITLYGRWILSE